MSTSDGMPRRVRGGLSYVTNNTRFLILPWVRVPHLASHVLGRIARRLSADWQAKYGHPIHLLETFVDTSRFAGTCYRAANWRMVGMTTGRTRQNKTQVPQSLMLHSCRAEFCQHYPIRQLFRIGSTVWQNDDIAMHGYMAVDDSRTPFDKCLVSMKLSPWDIFYACIATVVCASCSWADNGDPAEIVAIYADSSVGSDDNDGRSPGKAFRTLNAAQTALETEVAAGREVTLHLARGSVWREFREAEGSNGMSFGIPGLNVVAYGDGDLPTLSGFLVLPNDDFKQPAPEKFPNLWSQTIVPPESYAKSPPDGMRPGLLVGGNRPLRLIHPPGSRFATLRDFHGGIEGLNSEEDVLAFIAKNPNTYFPKENSDGSVEVFLNSGSDPTQDGLSYEFRVFPAGWIIHGSSIDGLRITGMGGRHGD